MPTVMNQPRSHFTTPDRVGIQKICIGMGVMFIVVGLAGIMMPGFMGMHLSMAHNLIHLASGALALWVGYTENSRRSYHFSLAFGSVYGLLGIFGFVLGQPGFPGVGQMESDQNLLRVIPNVLEFGTNDHFVHIFISAVFLGAAFVYKQRFQKAGRSIVDVQRRKEKISNDVFRTTTTRPDVPNSQTDLSQSELGHSDISRPIDKSRRDDFERRI